MLTVACVEWGNYLGRGAKYVENLQAMVARHLTVPHKVVCLTEDPRRHAFAFDAGLELVDLRGVLCGWWNKIELFRPDRFHGRVLYLDLDTLIVGSLDELVKHKGLLHLDRWGWKNHVYGSGVMCWDAGEHENVFHDFSRDVPGRFEGDQNWIQACGEWPALPDGACVSYRYHCKSGPPPGASVVAFHGRPKCHEFEPGHWVSKAWR